MVDFVEVQVVATGEVIAVPADWVGDPVLGPSIEKTVAQKIRDGEVKPEKAAEPPTESDTHKVIDKFAKGVGLVFEDGMTKAAKIAVINEQLATAPEASPEPEPTTPTAPEANPGVQTVLGESDTQSTIPAFRTDLSTTAVPNETPATGDEEN